MALNNFKCNHLMPLRFKWLSCKQRRNRKAPIMERNNLLYLQPAKGLESGKNFRLFG